MTNTTIETIGCDLGDKTSEICVLAGDGSKVRATVRTTRKGMTEFFTQAAAHVVIEVGTHSRWVNAVVSASDSKTDRHDAELLARLGRADVDLLAPVEHRSEGAQKDLAVAKSRDILVATRTKLINHVRGTIKSVGERIPSCAAPGFARNTRDLIPADLKPALDPVYDCLLRIEER